jgi:hypothetical protein
MERRQHAWPDPTYSSSPVKSWLRYSQDYWYLSPTTTSFDLVPYGEGEIECTFSVQTFPENELVVVGKGMSKNAKYAKEKAAKAALMFIKEQGEEVFRTHIEHIEKMREK